METLDELLSTLKKREYKTFEESSTQLEEVRKLNDAIVAFEKESLAKFVPATFTKTQQFLGRAKNEISKLEYDAKNAVERTLKQAFDGVKSAVNRANDLPLNRYDEGPGLIEKAKVALNEVDTAPNNLLPAFKAQVVEYRTKLEVVEKKILDSLTERVVKSKISDAKNQADNAKNMHFQSRHDDALKLIAKARASIADLTQPSYNTHPLVTAFLPDYIKRVDDLETQIGESMYGRVINEKISQAKSAGNKAKDMHFQSRYDESLQFVAKAREVVAELQSTFGSNKLVTDFLPAFIAHIDDIETKCGEAMYGRIIKEKIDKAKSAGNKAKDMQFQSRYDEALELIAQAREIVAEIQSTFGSNKLVTDFLPAFIVQIDGLEAKCGEQMFGRVINEKIDKAKSAGNKAKDMQFQCRYDEALELIAQARELMAEMANPPYATFKTVVDFLPAFTKQLDDLEAKCGENMLARLANEKMSKAKSHGDKAKDMLSRNRPDESLEAIANAREVVIELQQGPWNSLAQVAQFLLTFTKQIDEYEKQCSESLASRANQALRFNEPVAKNTNHSSSQSVNNSTTARQVVAPGNTSNTAQVQVDKMSVNTSTPVLFNAHVSETNNTAFGDSSFSNAQEYSFGADDAFGNSSVAAEEDSFGAAPTDTSAPSPYLAEDNAPNAAEQKGRNLSGFPNGPVSDVVGPWVQHTTSSLTGLQAQPDTPPKTRSFIIKWNTSVLQINDMWKESIEELKNHAIRAENPPVDGYTYYNAPRSLDRAFESADWSLKDLAKELNNIPSDENDTVRQAMAKQIKSAKDKLAQNIAQLRKVTSFTEVLVEACTIYNQLPKPNERSTRFAETIKEKLQKLTSKFHRIPPYQELINKAIFEIDIKEKFDKIHNTTEQLLKSVRKGTPLLQQKSVMEYLKVLEPWPLAYHAAIRRLLKVWTKLYRFSQHEWKPEFEPPAFPAPTAPTDWWQPTETDLNLHDYDMVRPGTPEQSGLPYANRPDSTSDPMFCEYSLPFAGQIVFGSDEIPAYIRKDELKTKFNMEETIYARAVWPTSLANFAIGKKRSDGSPVYTSDRILHGPAFFHGSSPPSFVLSLMLKIDGKPVHSKYAFQNSFGHVSDPRIYTDQSYGFLMLGFNEAFFTSWDVMPRSFHNQLVMAGPGVHKIEISVHYNIFEEALTCQLEYPESINTLMSHPLAKGSFEIQVPDPSLKVPDTFGPSMAEEYPMGAISYHMQNKTREQLLWCMEENSWYVVEAEEEIFTYDEDRQVMIGTKKPAKYGRDYVCLSYRSPEQGWKQEAAVCSILLVVATSGQNWDNGGSEIQTLEEGVNMDVDCLPENLIAAIKHRCAPKFRNI